MRRAMHQIVLTRAASALAQTFRTTVQHSQRCEKAGYLGCTMTRVFRNVVFVSVAAVVFAATGPMNATGQAATTPRGSRAAAFDVASIRESKASDGHHHIWSDVRVSDFRAANVSILDLVQYAYDLPKSRIVSDLDWLDSTTYDVNAKAGSELDAQLRSMTHDEAAELKRAMLQDLLKQRFSLKEHEETRKLAIYDLVLSKGGARLRHFDGGGTTVNSSTSRIRIQGGDTLELLCRELAQVVERVVVNRTGLKESYDVLLMWTPDGAPPPLLNGAPDPNAPPGLFTAIQEQLGLKLNAGKGGVSVLVIDGVQRPSEN
jgi:uncharacterized protein (TIGR03435 family)